jgi:hypothetical protein
MLARRDGLLADWQTDVARRRPRGGRRPRTRSFSFMLAFAVTRLSFFGILAHASAFAGCAPQGAGPCGYAAYGSCNVQATAQLQPLDEIHGCIGATVSVAGLCVSSSLDLPNPNCFHAASIAPECAISPDGAIYLGDLTNDEYVSGPGWRSTHYETHNGSDRPAASITTNGDRQRCAAALCAPPCVGSEIGVYAEFCVDGGSSVGARDAAGVE